jgi:dTDP-4-amino-4,6-dideoxy-D-galactose acyltransferase
MIQEPCEFLAWDTDFWGCRIGRSLIHRLTRDDSEAILSWIDSNRIDCLYFLADADHPETLLLAQEYGFGLRDIRITFDLVLQGVQSLTLPEGLEIRPVRPGDVNALRAMSRTAFGQTRFYNDPCFPNELCDELYDTWVRKSCLEGFADHVLVAETNREVIGYVTCQVSAAKSEGSIGLIGIAEAGRGQQIGQHLLRSAFNWFSEKNLKTASVVTQGVNISAQRLYQKCGFRTRSLQLWYHRWTSDCISKEVNLKHDTIQNSV